MADSRPPLAGFDRETFDTISEETALSPDRLRTLTRRHQQSIRDLPGIDNIVYEWRNHFHLDPLLARTDTVYTLALPDHVWDEFADRLDVSETELDGLRAVHDHQARRLVDPTHRLDDEAAFVLTRP